MEFAHPGEALPQIEFVPVVVPEHPNHAHPKLPKRLGNERRHKIARMEHELHPALAKEGQSPA
jgi:hypothetical protein